MLNRLPSLRTRLALLFGAFAIALTCALSVVYEESAAWRLRVAQEARLAQAASQLADRLDRDMYERLRDVILLASTDGLRTLLQVQADGRARLERMQKSFSNYAWIGVTDEAGRIVVATGGLLEGASAAERPWFAAARKGPAALDAHPALMLEPYLPKTGPEPLRLVDVAAPIIEDQGRIRGVVSAHLSLSWADEVRQAISRSIGDLQDAEILIISQRGEILVGPTGTAGRFLHNVNGEPVDTAATASVREGPAAYLGAVAATRGYRSFQGFGWTIVARQPVVAAYASVRGLRTAMLVAGLGIGLLFVLGGTVIAGTAAQSLEALAEAADGLRSVPPVPMPPIDARYSEVQLLMQSLASTFAELQNRKNALRALNNTLELKVAERTQDLKAAKDVAEAATRAKTDFLATMSHELRSPLASIIGFCDLVLETPDLDPTVRRRLELIQSAGSALTCVINDILDFSKIEAGRVDIVAQPFSLASLLDGCISIMHAQANAKGVALAIEAEDQMPAFVVGDEGRMRQVLLNLLNNAVKFTKAGQVTLRIDREPCAGTSLRFSVIDTGIGIPEDQLGRLFQRFSQADSAVEREFGGTGLGLAISQRLVGLMGGEITVRSRVGGGSTFSFTVPLPETTARREATPVVLPGVATRPLRILLAEDLLPNQEIATTILARAGHTVDVVGDGQEAVEAAATGQYDLILMDVQMPRMDGLAATRLIRGLPHPVAKIPIIAMTANVLPEQVQRFRRGGMDGHVGKPIDAGALFAQIHALAARTAHPDGSEPSGPPARLPSAIARNFDAARHNELVELLGPERVQSYLHDLDERLQLLPQSSLDESTRDLGSAAHKMAALAGMLGFSKLSESCAHLDAACGDNPDDVQHTLARVNAAAIHVFGIIVVLGRDSEGTDADHARREACAT